MHRFFAAWMKFWLVFWLHVLVWGYYLYSGRKDDGIA